MTKVATTATVAADKVQAVKKEYKNSFAVRESKAAASARHRQRAKLAKEGLEIPAELAKREGYQRGNKTVDEANLTDVERTKLAALRESKKGSTTRFKERQKLLASGVAIADLPEHLQPRVGKKSTADAAVAKAVSPRQPKLDPEQPVTYADLKQERKLRRGGQDVFIAMTCQNGSNYTLRKFTRDENGEQVIATRSLKRQELPTTLGAYIKLADKTKPAQA